MDSGRGEIVVRRNADNDIKMRGLDVYVDGLFAQDISYEQSYSVEVSAGSHTVKVSNRLYSKTLEFNLGAGETVEFLAGNSFTLVGGLMISVLGMGPYKVFLQEVSRRVAPVEVTGATV